MSVPIDLLCRSLIVGKRPAGKRPAPDPRVLVILDDNHHGEFEEDGEYIAQLLTTESDETDFLEETRSGIEAEMLAGYDVVWFTNPGYPMDDQATLDALISFNRTGGGVVLSGGDMTHTRVDASELTGVEFVNNGTSVCGVRSDNNGRDFYRVTIGDRSHPT